MQSIVLLLHFVCAMAQNQVGRPVIILAAISKDDSYYGKYYDSIVNFQVHFAKQILGKDNVIIAMPNHNTKRDYIAKGVPESAMIDFAFADIWMRDPSPVNMKHQALFTYKNSYLQASESKRIQQYIRQAITNACLRCDCTLGDIPTAALALDGGNVVDNFVDKAIITERVIKDNPRITRANIVNLIKNSTGYSKVALIPDLGDATGHSDGMVAFLDENTIGVTSTMTQQEIDQVKDKITKEFGQTKFVPLDSVYQEDYFRGFDSACGLHVNMVLTDDYLYVPVFGNDAKNQEKGQSTLIDNAVLATIRANTNREIVPIDVPYNVCVMGGSVRCLTWTIGAGALADCFTEWAKESK